MTFSMFRVMLLGLLRDRGALAMAFVLPPLIYVIFASIFSGTTGTQLKLRVAVLDVTGTEITQRLAKAVRADPGFRSPSREPRSSTDLEFMVRQDEADVGVLLRHDPTDPRQLSIAPVLVIGDSAKAVGTPIVAGQLQRLFGEQLPDAGYTRTFIDIEQRFVQLSPAQRGQVDAVIAAIRASATQRTPLGSGEAERKGMGAAQLVEQIDVRSTGTAAAAVVYYAGAVAILFLLFSAMQGGLTLIDERQSGILDRLLAGSRGIGALLGGKFLFLLVQGFCQAGLIFAVAAIAYQVNVSARLPEWTVITLAASAAAAGLALMLAAACRTRQQAQTLSNFLVLVLSALGGSMVPRFLMPPWLQTFSWTMPNAWAIEAYHGLLWRNAAMKDLALPVGLMLGFAIATLAAAWILIWRRQRA